jgi:hypothetical protein
MNGRTDPARMMPKIKKEGACSYSQAGLHPSFLQGSVCEHVWSLVRGAVWGACGTWGTVHARDHGERLPAASAVGWASRPSL